eukprot:4748787-Prymnesium_polylepis.1
MLRAARPHSAGRRRASRSRSSRPARSSRGTRSAPCAQSAPCRRGRARPAARSASLRSCTRAAASADRRATWSATAARHVPPIERTLRPRRWMERILGLFSVSRGIVHVISCAGFDHIATGTRGGY